VALAIVEPSLKYQPDLFAALTLARNPGRGPCMVGSLTGAVSSQRVTEEYEGTLTTVGNRGSMCIGKSVLDCETDKSSRCESRSK
jgi:Family of unknown function (DUF6467)